MKPVILAALIVTGFSSTAHAQDDSAKAGETFIEVGGGAGAVHAGSFEFINPQGGGYIATFPVAIPGVSKVVGNSIVLDRQRRNASSPSAEVSLGHFIGDRVYVRATYRYLGRFHLSGSAAFPIDPAIPLAVAFDQDYDLRGHAAYLGIGYQADLTGALFVDLSAEAGAARLRSVSRQGANVGDPLGHPARTVTNVSAGGELGLGVHIGRRYDLVFKGRADLLGTAMTGIVPVDTLSADGNFGINAGEQLKLHRVTSYGLAMTLRARF